MYGNSLMEWRYLSSQKGRLVALPGGEQTVQRDMEQAKLEACGGLFLWFRQFVTINIVHDDPQAK